MNDPTHAELVQATAEARRQQGAAIVVTEARARFGAEGECADVVSWFPNLLCIVDEVKVSLSDWKKDGEKPHIESPWLAMGNQRFYVCPDFLIESYQAEQRHHGLCYVGDGGFREIVDAPRRNRFNAKAQHDLLLAHLLRERMQGGAVTVQRQPRVSSGAGCRIADDLLDKLRAAMEADPMPWTVAEIKRVLGTRMQNDKLADELARVPWLHQTIVYGQSLFELKQQQKGAA